MPKTKPIVLITGGLFLFLVDRWLKWQALHSWARAHLLNRWLGWRPFFNPGVAFGLPLPRAVIVALTVGVISFILGYLFVWVTKFKVQNISDKISPAEQPALKTNNEERNFYGQFLGLWFILMGAASNLIDRLVYSHTVDYWLIFTAVINLADGLIVVGFLMYVGTLKGLEK